MVTFLKFKYWATCKSQKDITWAAALTWPFHAPARWTGCKRRHVQFWKQGWFANIKSI